MLKNRIIYLVFWILNEYICIGIRKILTSTKYLIGSMYLLYTIFSYYFILF